MNSLLRIKPHNYQSKLAKNNKPINKASNLDSFKNNKIIPKITWSQTKIIIINPKMPWAPLTKLIYFNINQKNLRLKYRRLMINILTFNWI